ncbi:hypothetical protein [Georgenia daeguensis]|uniref:Uncharacterized protein n=1 Tax=Georgenia daeguensis TaxID=908355 RepID=A0ABP8ERB9_9MICO
MAPEEFGGPALVLGSVRGRRSFGVTADGRLTGLYYSQVWHPGENRASCLHDGGVVVRLPDGRITVRAASEREIGAGHGLQGCTCGFYAYYREDPYSTSRRISGVVEGYGRVVLGTAGFRAERARILALLVPGTASGPGADARPRPGNISGPGWDAGGSRDPDVPTATGRRAPREPSGREPFSGATSAEEAPVDVARIRAAYPEVAFFDRAEDMLAACPPTVNGPEI